MIVLTHRPHLTVKYRVTGCEGSVRAAGEPKRGTKWIDPLQIREREIGPIRTEVTERVLIFQRPKRTRNVFEIRLKTNIKERRGSSREIETAGNSVRSRRLSVRVRRRRKRRAGMPRGRRRAAAVRQRRDQGGSLQRRLCKAASSFNKDRIAEREGRTAGVDRRATHTSASFSK